MYSQEFGPSLFDQSSVGGYMGGTMCHIYWILVPESGFGRHDSQMDVDLKVSGL